MQLEINGDAIIDSPNEDAIKQALLLMTEPGGFAILSHDDMNYIQAAGSLEEGFVLECQNDSLDEHYACAMEQLNADTIARAFIDYLCDGDWWRNELPWEKETL